MGVVVNSHINPAIILKLKPPHIEPLALNFGGTQGDSPSVSLGRVVSKHGNPPGLFLVGSGGGGIEDNQSGQVCLIRVIWLPGYFGIIR